MTEKKRAAEAGARAAQEEAKEKQPEHSAAPEREQQDAVESIVADHDAARRFLHVLDPEADFFTFQTFDDRPAKQGKLARIRHGTFDEVVRSLDALQQEGAGVFVTINETDGQGRQAHNIKRVRALFVDLDGAPLAPVIEAQLAPHIIIESSPGKYHAYWLCDDCPLDQFERVQRALATRFGGDPSVHDLPRVMRLPGFRHLKGAPYISRLHDDLNSLVPSYTLAEIVGTLRLDLGAKEAKPAPVNTPDAAKVKPGSRHSHLFASGRSMAHRLSPEAVRAALAAENQERCDPPLPDADIDYLAKRAFEAKDAAGWVTTPTSSPTSAPSGINEEASWPEPLEPAAFHGLVGQIVQLVGPESEADPAALLLQPLVWAGAAFGRGTGIRGGPYFLVEDDRHHTNLYAVAVGATSKARKGTSLGRVREIFRDADSLLNEVSGLSSGEGLKWNVRDPLFGHERDKKTKQLVKVETDPGVLDKRLLVIESEFAQVLKQSARTGNTLSPVVRNAWDSGNLKTLTKTDPVTVTGAHIAIIGHITSDELRRELNATEQANGFANRFLYFMVRRSKALPRGGRKLDPAILASIKAQLQKCVTDAKLLGEVGMTDAADALWAEVYPALSDSAPGLLGVVTARAEAQCVRLALVYALLDGSTEIDVPHLQAALAVWKYCEASARYIFGSALGDPAADEILRALRAVGAAGLTRTDISYGLFKRHKTTAEIDVALQLLHRRKLAYPEQKSTAGRASEIWRAGWR